MKSLNEISIRDVKEDGKYLVHMIEYERFGDSESQLLVGSGSEVITFIKESVGFEDDNIEDLFTWFEENNGDGDDFFSIFEVEK